jgi:hypothetical protein
MMIRLLTVLVCVVAIVSFLPAAPVPEHLMPKESPLYYAMKKGASWVYLEGEEEYRYAITEVEKDMQGDAAIVTVCARENGKETPYRKVKVSREGLRWLSRGSSAYDKPIWALLCPVQANQKWSVQYSGPGIANGEGTMKVTGTETVKVPAGTFSTVRVEMTLLVPVPNQNEPITHHETSWYSAGIGLVKRESGDNTRVLKSFTRGKD